MAWRTEPPFRADHVGSLLRPPELLEARADHAAGTIDAHELRGIEDEAIREGIRMQEAVGLESATDGELRRGSWHMDFIYQLGGVEKLASDLVVEFKNAERRRQLHAGLDARRRAACGSSTRSSRDDFTFLRENVATARAEAHDPVAEHGALPRGPCGDRRGGLPRPRRSSGPTSRPPIARRSRASASSAARYLQLDDTSLAYLNDPAQREHIAQLGGDRDHQHEAYIRYLNEAIASRPEGMRVTTHMCRGNFRSSWYASGDYEYVAEVLLNELNVDGFFMEWDDARSGGFEPLRFLPPGKVVVLGLVTTKSGELERKDDLKRRIDEAARFADIDQLCLSGQCGFSSTVDGNDLSLAQQEAKLNLIVETAREVWG